MVEGGLEEAVVTWVTIVFKNVAILIGEKQQKSRL